MDRVQLWSRLRSAVAEVDVDACARVAALLETDAPFSRANVAPGHITASALVASPDGAALLLIRHRFLGLWLQPGGHVEAEDPSIEAAARREVAEEAGVTALDVVGPHVVLDVDVHAIPANPAKGEGPHLHHDVRVGFRARSWELFATDEVAGARWVPFAELAAIDTDDSVRRSASRLQARLQPAPRREAPAVARNRQPLAEVLDAWIPRGATVVEVGSGTGEHAAWLAPRLGVRWCPTDVDPVALGAIDAAGVGVDGVLPARHLDVAAPWWDVPDPDVVLAVNVLHIVSWAEGRALLAGAARCLAEGGRLVVYGPFRALGAHTAPSNASFDAWLRARDAQSGVRDVESVVSEAAAHGLAWEATVPMPANNVVVVFRRRAGPADPRIGELLEAWFGRGTRPTDAQRAAWWRADPEHDAALRAAFGDVVEAALDGELDGWARTRRGHVALTLALDQLPRNLFRGTPRMYAGDRAAQRLARLAAGRGDHRTLPVDHAMFAFMPLLHAEDAALQDLGVVTFRAIADRGDEAVAGVVSHAERHRAVVRRFGRFPHRNAILGRETTADEAQHLRDHPMGF